MTTTYMSILLTFTALLAGIGAGAAARLLLARMRRGARVRAPVCELAVGALWSATAWVWVSGWLPGSWLPALFGLSWLGVAASVVDVRHHRLPNALTLPALPVALALLLPLGPGSVLRGVVGAVIAVLAHALLHLVAPAAMGAGDVKLAAPIGAVLGAASGVAVVLAMVVAVVLSGIGAVVGVAFGRLGRSGAVPHGPSMLAAGWVVATGTAVSTAVGGPVAVGWG